MSNTPPKVWRTPLEFLYNSIILLFYFLISKQPRPPTPQGEGGYHWGGPPGRSHISVYTYMHACMRAYIHTHACMHAYIHTCIHTYIHTYVRTYIHTYIHTYRHTYRQTYIQTDIHTYIYSFAWGAIRCTADQIWPRSFWWS